MHRFKIFNLSMHNISLTKLYFCIWTDYRWRKFEAAEWWTTFATFRRSLSLKKVGREKQKCNIQGDYIINSSVTRWNLQITARLFLNPAIFTGYFLLAHLGSRNTAFISIFNHILKKKLDICIAISSNWKLLFP